MITIWLWDRLLFSYFTEPEPMFNVDVDTSGVVGGGAGPYVYASFPVDVVVYFHMQPSTIRYTHNSMLMLNHLRNFVYNQF